MTLALTPGPGEARPEVLARAVASLWTPPAERLDGGWLPRPLPAVAWEVVLRPGGATTWYLTTPAEYAHALHRQAQVAWPAATVEPAPDPFAGLAPAATGVGALQKHFLFPLRVDRRTQAPLPALLECTRLLGDGEAVAVQVLMVPAPPDWWAAAVPAYEQYRRGRMPRRVGLDARALAQGGARLLAGLVLETVSVVGELLAGEPPPVAAPLDGTDLAYVLRERPDGARIAAKLRGEAVDVTVRVAVQAQDPHHARAVLRAVAWAFRELDGDNALVVEPAPAERVWPAMLARQAPLWKPNHDYLATWEAAQLLHLPTPALAREHGLAAVEHREIELPPAVTSGGLRMGVATFRGHQQVVYIPTNDHDELCLPRVVIGGMGSGKTRGFAANLAAEAVRAGFTAIVFDPARGEIGDELEAVLEPHQITRVRLGREPVALDWREVLHAPRARNRLAAELVGFFEAAADDAGAQTVRYLRAAAKAAPRGRLSEIVALLTDPEYRQAALPAMRPPERATWEAFGRLSDARQAQIAAPVLNRLDVITGDDYLLACLEAERGLDMVGVMNRAGHVLVVDAPKAELGAEALDVLGALLATKVNLAMMLRTTQHPVLAIWDEPHQYLRSARVWRSAAVESRKWRVGYCWLFHAWEQLPKDVAAIIRAALPHYHLYPSSAATYRALEAEIAPWTVEEALRIPRYHALHVLRAGGRTVPPFVSRMDPPPSRR